MFAQALLWLSPQVSHIQQNTKIPVMGHADGICHIYVDEVPKLPSPDTFLLSVCYTLAR